MDEKVLESLDSFVDEYASTRGKHHYQTEDGNARYALLDSTSKGKLKLKRISYYTCFGRLNHLDYEHGLNVERPEALLIQIQKSLYGKDDFDKEFHLYYEWLFNFSPFRDAFITKDAAKTIDKGIIVVDTTIDSRIMIGGAISTRHPWENFAGYAAQMRPIMRLWKKMVEEGMNPNYAFVLAFGLRTNDNGATWMITNSGFGHQVLPYSHYEDAANNYHHNFANDRKRKDKSSIYRDDLTYNSPMHIFGLNVNGEHSNFHEWTKKHLQIAATGKAKKVNPFGGGGQTNVAKTENIIAHFSDLQSEFLTAA